MDIDEYEISEVVAVFDALKATINVNSCAECEHRSEKNQCTAPQNTNRVEERYTSYKLSLLRGSVSRPEDVELYRFLKENGQACEPEGKWFRPTEDFARLMLKFGELYE